MIQVAHKTAGKAKAPKVVAKFYEAVNSQSTFRYVLFCPAEKTFALQEILFHFSVCLHLTAVGE